MIHVAIPGRGDFALELLALDFNGTIAGGGAVLPGVAERLAALAHHLEIHVLTADTYGTVRAACAALPVTVAVLDPEQTTEQKSRWVQAMGAARVVAVGNGYNDHQMLARARLGICVAGPEGAAVEALSHAQIVVHRIEDALDLLLYPERLKATLRT